MASTPKQVNGSSNNSTSEKRKKTRGSKSSYLSKWLDKTMHHIQDATPNMDAYDYVSPTVNWPSGGSQFAPGYEPYRHMYAAPEPLSLPTLPTYYSPPVFPMYGPDPRYFHNVKGIPIQRPRMRHRADLQNRNCMPTDPNYLQPKNLSDSQDYTSLPPIITSVGDTTSNSDMNDKEKDDARRFSDPCVGGLPDVTQPGHGDVDSETDEESSEAESQVGSRLVSCLLDQIRALKQANERLNRDLTNTRLELDSIRHHTMLHKGSSSSIGATPSHSQEGAGLVNGQYNPGFLTDLVREIRDGARMKEDAMFAKVRSMMIERNENVGSSEAKINEKALEEIKSSLRASEADKRHMMDRINKLEDEVHALKIANGSDTSDKMNGNVEDAETERLRLRKELADMKKSKQNSEEQVHKSFTYLV